MKKKKILFLLNILLFVSPLFVFSGTATFTGIQNPIESNDFFAVIDGVLNFLKPFGVAVLVVMVFVGAFQYLFAGVNPKMVENGRKTLTWAVIGFAILLLSNLIISTIQWLFA